MVFGEVSYREPVRMRRPDRDVRLACVAYQVPSPADMPIFLDRNPADAIERHALRDTSVELGGILLGRECLDDETGEPFVWVTEALEAKHYENTQASFTYTHDSWEEITRERDRLHPDLDIVGWYHTHPDFGIFLSSHDLFIHRNFFDQPLQVAYVVDPIRQTRGFFRWKEGGLEQVGGFYLSGDRNDRLALARLVNDLENIPNAETGGSGLSPRLEAELIAMLSRPAYQAPPASDRAVTAAFGSLVGLLLGVLGFAAVLWVNSLNQQIREQAEKIKTLGESVSANTEMQRMALDALLHKGEAGPGVVDPFTSAYKRALSDRDRFRARVDNLSAANEQLGGDYKLLKANADEMKTRLAKAEAEAKENEAEAKEAKRIRSELTVATNQIATQNSTIARKEELLSATGEEKAAELIRKAKWSMYLAIAGWVVAICLGIGLVALWAFGNPIPPDEPVPTRSPDEPPHIIT
jgi:proteasome lid subunit RPN8/RPN11/CHASE3 domain sensor protein